ncbi:MAG: hypothetical protein ABI970_00015 [Chloroflexota bacterium]
MPTENFNDVIITGNQDTIQLQVKGNTTQTDPLQTWEDSAGDALVTVTADGRVQVGDDVGLASPDALIEAHRQYTSTTKPKRGIHSLGRISDTLTNVVQWVVAELEIRGSDAISALHTALRVKVSSMNTGIPTAAAELRGGDIEVVNDTTASTSALPKATGLQVGITNAASKTITNAIGLKVKMNNAGAITNPYSIYTEGQGPFHLEDYMEVKQPTVVPTTPAPDFIRIYPGSDGRLYAKNWDGQEFALTTLPQKQTEIDFGILGTRSKTFTITDADIAESSILMAVQSGNAATDRAQDENEMDALILRCAAAEGEFTLFADSLFGPVSGKYKINYSIS